MAIRVVVVEEWDEADYTEEMTAEQALAAAGVEYDPATHILVSKVNGVIEPDAILEDEDTIYIEPIEGVDDDEEDDEEDDEDGDDAAADGGEDESGGDAVEDVTEGEAPGDKTE